MAQLNHPTIKNVTVNVPRGDVKDWEKAGWVQPATSTEASDANKGADSTTITPPDAANKKE
jgi:hypothetical protein